MSKIIIIEGYLASGKSTFAKLLSKELKIPCLIKDDFKSALCESVSISTRSESSRFSAVTFDAMMYVTERLLETDSPIIIEGNFTPPGVKKVDEEGMIRGLAEKYNCRTLTFKFFADTKILYRRFIEREKTPERGKANIIFREPAYEEFDLWCKNLLPFDIGGKIIRIDTTSFEMVDFSQYIETAKLFLLE